MKAEMLITDSPSRLFAKNSLGLVDPFEKSVTGAKVILTFKDEF